MRPMRPISENDPCDMLRALLRSRWTAVAWTLLIFALLMAPPGNIPKTGLLGLRHLDKIVHCLLFCGFGLLWSIAGNEGNPSTSRMWAVFLAGCAYGVGMEFVQDIFTKRSFESLDMLADIAGSAIAGIWLGKNKPLWK